MRHCIHPVRFAGIVMALALAPGLAMAYIDPGNGAYMVQVLFTLIGAGLFYLRHPIRTLQAVARWCMNRLTGRADVPTSTEVEEGKSN